MFDIWTWVSRAFQITEAVMARTLDDVLTPFNRVCLGAATLGLRLLGIVELLDWIEYPRWCMQQRKLDD